MSLRTATRTCPTCGYPTLGADGDACLLCAAAPDPASSEARGVIERAFDRIRGGACEEEAHELWQQVDRAELALRGPRDGR